MNDYIKSLYDRNLRQTATEGPGGQMMTELDERKLRRELDGNKKLMARNAETFSAGEPKFHSCAMYQPCPICDKCRNKASHLYVRCQTCQIPICVHTHAQRKKMIRRENFMLNLDASTKASIRATYHDYRSRHFEEHEKQAGSSQPL